MDICRRINPVFNLAALVLILSSLGCTNYKNKFYSLEKENKILAQKNSSLTLENKNLKKENNKLREYNDQHLSDIERLNLEMKKVNIEKPSKNITSQFQKTNVDGKKYSDLINQIENINEILVNLSCKTDDFMGGLGKITEGLGPYINSGLDIATNLLEDNIPDGWENNTKEFIEASKIVYDRLNIKMKIIPKSSITPTVDSDGKFEARALPVKELAGGTLVLVFPECIRE